MLRKHASSLTVAIEPPARAAATSSTASFSIKASKFHCNHRGTDTVFDPKPEYYFIFTSTAGTTTLTTKSTVFNNVDTGETHNFSSVDGDMWGLTGHPAPLPTGDIGMLVTLFDHDSGDPEAVREGVAAAVAAASGILLATGFAAWGAAVVVAVGGVITWLTTFMNDDYIAGCHGRLRRSGAGQAVDLGRRVHTERGATDRRGRRRDPHHHGDPCLLTVIPRGGNTPVRPLTGAPGQGPAHTALAGGPVCPPGHAAPP